jgi:hypothetical protein
MLGVCHLLPCGRRAIPFHHLGEAHQVGQAPRHVDGLDLLLALDVPILGAGAEGIRIVPTVELDRIPRQATLHTPIEFPFPIQNHEAIGVLRDSSHPQTG